MYLWCWKGVIPPIAQFDPDRGGIHVTTALPKTLARMPRTHIVGNQLRHSTAFRNHVMGRYLMHSITQPFNRLGSAVHRCIMQDHPFWHQPPFSFAKIWRRDLIYDHFLIAARKGVGSHRQANPSPSGSSP